MEKDKIDISQESELQLKLRLENLMSKLNISDDITTIDNLKNISDDDNQEISEIYYSIQKKILEKQKKQETPIVNDDDDSELLHYGLDDEIQHESKLSDTRNEVDMKELEKAIQLVSDARKILYNLLDKKLDEHSMNYYIREKGIGSKSIQELKYNRDKVQVSTLIHNLEKMI